MLDLYAQCPACGNELHGQNECQHCHRKSGARAKRLRRLFDVAVGALVFGLLGLNLAVPELFPARMRLIGAKEAEAVEEGRWTGPLPAPPARTWAAPLEPSLTSACTAASGHMHDANYLASVLAPRIASVEVIAAGGTPDARSWRRLTAEEKRDAVGTMGGSQEFVYSCLRWSYGALESCSRFASSLSSPEAEKCLVAPVQRAVLVTPWTLCAKGATLPLVKAACQRTADELGLAIDGPSLPVR